MIDPVGGVRKPTSVATRIAPPPVSASSPAATVPQLLELVADLARAEPPIDQPRIAQLRRAIADGNYVVDPHVIARAMIGWNTTRG